MDSTDQEVMQGGSRRNIVWLSVFDAPTVRRHDLQLIAVMHSTTGRLEFGGIGGRWVSQDFTSEKRTGI